METRAHHVIIGLFTVITALGIVLFMLWLARPATERDYNYYVIDFTRRVSGLDVGSRVEYSGVRVGEVIDLALDQRDPGRVHALIRVDKDTPVNVETKADLALANISGAMKIQLYGGRPTSDRLHGSMRNPPVIAAEPSLIAEALEASEEMIVGISEFVERANALLSEENIAHISQSLKNLEDISQVVAGQRAEISQALSDFARLSRESSRALEGITALADNTDASLNAPDTGVLTRAGQVVVTLERASERVDRLLSENESAVSRGLGSLSDLDPALNELRSALANLNRITERLEANPRQFLFGGEDLREFEP